MLESELPLRSLVAITFTDKAAREMRNRIRAFTTQWLAQADAANREVWAEAFSALDAARISTIHGLCATLLRAHPAEAGLDPAFDVLDEGQSAVWRARAVDEHDAIGQWSPTASFFVNTANDPPDTPVLNNPVSGGTDTSLTPTLSVFNAADLDQDALRYEFELYADADLSQLVAAAVVDEGHLITAWTVSGIGMDTSGRVRW